MAPTSDWWARAKQPPRPEPIEIRTRETICTLRKDEHHVALEKRDVPAMGEELILSVNGHWRRMRVFTPQGPLLSSAASATISTLEQGGWGYSLSVVYLVWVVVVVGLYPPCRWFADVRRRQTDWWLSYL